MRAPVRSHARRRGNKAPCGEGTDRFSTGPAEGADAEKTSFGVRARVRGDCSYVCTGWERGAVSAQLLAAVT